MILGFIGIFMPILSAILLFLMKQMTDIKKTMASLGERIAREETKSTIYHEKHDMEDK